MLDRTVVPASAAACYATIPMCGLVDVQATEAAVVKLNRALGFELPQLGYCITGPGGIHAYGLAPGHWLLRVAADTEESVVDQIRGALASDHAVATVVSDAYMGLRLVAADAMHVLAQGCPLDLDVLSTGTCARTILARVTVLIVHNDIQAYELWVERSHEVYLRGWIDAALELPKSASRP